MLHKVQHMQWVNGTAISTIRDLRNMSQRKLARDVGIDSGHMSRIEKGETDPGRELAGRIAAALTIPLAAIVDLHQCHDGPAEQRTA